MVVITKLSNPKEYKQLILKKLLALQTINLQLDLARSMVATHNQRTCEQSQMSVETPISISNREITQAIVICSKTHSSEVAKLPVKVKDRSAPPILKTVLEV